MILELLWFVSWGVGGSIGLCGLVFVRLHFVVWWFAVLFCVRGVWIRFACCLVNWFGDIVADFGGLDLRCVAFCGLCVIGWL